MGRKTKGDNLRERVRDRDDMSDLLRQLQTSRQGKVKFFDSNRGFGVIKYEGGEIFFHHSALPGNSNLYKTIEPGQEVVFSVGVGRNGKAAANFVDPYP